MCVQVDVGQRQFGDSVLSCSEVPEDQVSISILAASAFTCGVILKANEITTEFILHFNILAV